jgi:hypothetical protein
MQAVNNGNDRIGNQRIAAFVSAFAAEHHDPTLTLDE